MEQGLPETSNQDALSSEPKFVNMVGKTYSLSNQHWHQTIDYSQEKDFITQSYGEMPTQEKVLEMRNARFKGATYERKEKSTTTKQYKPKVTIPPVIVDFSLVFSHRFQVKFISLFMTFSEK